MLADADCIGLLSEHAIGQECERRRLRLGLTVYVGALAHGLAYNAMFSPFAVRNISDAVGIVTASLVGILLYLREANPPTQDGPIR